MSVLCLDTYQNHSFMSSLIRLMSHSKITTRAFVPVHYKSSIGSERPSVFMLYAATRCILVRLCLLHLAHFDLPAQFIRVRLNVAFLV